MIQFREIAVALAAIPVLVFLLVTGGIVLLSAWSRRGDIQSYGLLVALRILVGYGRRDGGGGRVGFRRRLLPVSAQNFIAMVGTALGVWALVVVLSVMGGFESDLKGKIVRFSPHVTVRPGDDPSGDIARNITLALSDSIPHATAVESYAEGEAMLTSSTNMSPGLILRGLDAGGRFEGLWLKPTATADALESLRNPVRLLSDRELGFRRRTATAPQVAEDDALAMPAIPSAPRRTGRVHPAILLGEELAHSLSVTIGDEVTAVIPDGDIGPAGVRPRTRNLRVAGTFMTGMYEYDLRTAYLSTGDLQELFLLGGPNRVGVILDDVDNLLPSTAVIEANPAVAGAEVRSVAQTNRSLFSALKIEKIAMFLVLGLVILVAAFNVFGSLTLVTLEKTRDLAVLRSLGGTGGGVRGIFLVLGGVIGTVGTVSGLVVGLLTCAYIDVSGITLPAEYYLRTVPVQVRPVEMVVVFVSAIAACLLAAVIPANAAARLSPSEGLRND